MRNSINAEKSPKDIKEIKVEGTVDYDRYHAILRSSPALWATVGVLHTLLTAGIVFGWASLLPILRKEASASTLADGNLESGHALSTLTPSEYARIFTYGAIGNYLSSLPFGILLDYGGPKLCGIIASLLFACGLVLCAQSSTSAMALAVGYGLLGFSGPAIQLPTLHLARLFMNNEQESQNKLPPRGTEGAKGSSNADTGCGGGAAFMMSAQAAAFDGGTAIFALFSLSAQYFNLSSRTFFLAYTVVPLMTLATSILVWPNKILPDPALEQNHQHQQEQARQEKGEVANLGLIRRNSSMTSYGGPGSPFLTPSRTLNRPHGRRAKTSKKTDIKSNTKQTTRRTKSTTVLRDAPLSIILSTAPFYCLALWVSIHILKLNFIVATLNDQLLLSAMAPSSSSSSSDVASTATATTLINIFGSMLPFGFVVLPLVASLLESSSTEPILPFQLANLIGIIYGTILTFTPTSFLLQACVVFPCVATSRQMVYSTVFHQVGEIFGFYNYGVLLGLINIMVSLASMIQSPLVSYSEYRQSYFIANLILDLLTIPLFGIVYWTTTSRSIVECESDEEEIAVTVSGATETLHLLQGLRPSNVVDEDEEGNSVCRMVRAHSAPRVEYSK